MIVSMCWCFSALKRGWANTQGRVVGENLMMSYNLSDFYRQVEWYNFGSIFLLISIVIFTMRYGLYLQPTNLKFFSKMGEKILGDNHKNGPTIIMQSWMTCQVTRSCSPHAWDVLKSFTLPLRASSCLFGET